mmetsp:Transcript_30249/g.46265  ORF Transcript_30249/g.46265 Transcript_30249/m.46265 type:complete len:217 (-) Transcript_30249:30-680(-)
MTGQRMMYYVPWCFTEAACIACGLGYNGVVNNKILWDKIVCIEVLGVELTTTPLVMMAKWNHATHLWLKHHVQQRLLKIGQKPGLKETLITFTVSAFWHGFYPSYYVMFFLCACLTEVSKDVYRARILFRFIPDEYVNLVANILSMMVLNYLGVTFNQLTIERVKIFSGAMYHYILILLPLILIVFRTVNIVGIAKRKEKALAAKKEKALDAKKEK